VVVNGPFPSARSGGANALFARVTRHARLAPLAVLALAGITAAGWFTQRQTQEIAGQIAGPARIIDGDSLVVAGVEIRLYGIDAPEYRQYCFRRGRPWRCGVEATRALRALIAGRPVACRAREQDRYGRTVAACAAGGVDLGAAMVASGHAVAYGAYDAEERSAREARRGIWSSSFDRPAAWRARHPRGPH
jgi:endonuclease YncB( thermonuclease family)